MMLNVLVNIFVYVPAFLFYLIIGFYAWMKACEKKNRELRENDGK